MLTIEYAKDPVYADVAGTCISLIVKFVEFADEMPFGATPYDSMPYGVELFNRAKAGEFGDIVPYVAPTEDQPVTTGTQTL